MRARAAAEKWYPANFAGWDDAADAVRDELRHMPPGTRVLADNFKLGAELGFALDDPRIAVLDHPLNRKHGRAPQLHLWRLDEDPHALLGKGPVLLVAGASEVEFKNLHRRYLELCRMVGPLPAPRVLNVDHGRQRIVLFRLMAPADGPCTAPAMAWIDAPTIGARVGASFEVKGWAFRQGVGLERVEATIDGRVVGTLRYGNEYAGLEGNWPGLVDPGAPKLGFSGRVDTTGIAPGRHWLGLRLHGRDGSVEPWPEQRIEVVAGDDTPG